MQDSSIPPPPPPVTPKVAAKPIVLETNPRRLFTAPKCPCSLCRNLIESPIAEIRIDSDELILSEQKANTSFVQLLRQLFNFGWSIVPFRMVDTFIINRESGNIEFAILRVDDSMKIVRTVANLQTTLLRQKDSSDLDYQKRKYQRQKKGFFFTHLDHESEKLIKQFESKIHFLHSSLNRVATLEPFDGREQQVLSKSEFIELTDKGKLSRSVPINYLQVFPIMTGEEEYSHVRRICYFRSREEGRPLFKMAEFFILCWLKHNESLEKMEEEYIAKLAEMDKTGSEHAPPLLNYMAFKIFLSFELTISVRVTSAQVCFMTNDSGHTYMLKSIDHIQCDHLPKMGQTVKTRPTKSDYGAEDHISLVQEMKAMFGRFQLDYSRLEQERRQIDDKERADRELSDKVFKTINPLATESLETILNSKNQNYKKTMLCLN